MGLPDKQKYVKILLTIQFYLFNAFMAKNLFIWLLIILLLISSSLFALELLGKDEYRPSLKFGADKSQDIIDIKQKLQSIEDKVDKLENSRNTAQKSPNTLNTALNSAQNTVGTIQNGANLINWTNGTTGLGLQSSRPSTFDLDQEVLTDLETIPATSGGKLSNAQNEVFIFNAGDSSLFNPSIVKAGDKFKVTAKVSNNAGVYTFQTITKVERVI